MKHLKAKVCGVACAMALASFAMPVQASAAIPAEIIILSQQETKPDFQNPNGMTVSLIYYYLDQDGNEKEVGKADRVIIPAGTATVTVELQMKGLPEGYSLKDAADFQLQEDTQELKILVAAEKTENDEPSQKPTEPSGKPTEPTEKPAEPTEKPAEPSEKPAEPTEKPAEPSEKPAEPTEKPTEPSEKPAEPTEKPTKPSEKPAKPAEKPNQPAQKPDPSNPKTGDPHRLGLWLSLGAVSAGATLIFWKKRFILER